MVETGPLRNAALIHACCAGEPLHTDGLGMEEAETNLPQHPKKRRSVYSNEILYGIINAIVGAPTMISFAAIVYQVPLWGISSFLSLVSAAGFCC
jgi:hypothetical protein